MNIFIKVYLFRFILKDLLPSVNLPAARHLIKIHMKFKITHSISKRIPLTTKIIQIQFIEDDQLVACPAGKFFVKQKLLIRYFHLLKICMQFIISRHATLDFKVCNA